VVVVGGFGWFHVLVTTLLVFNFNGNPEIICMTNILNGAILTSKNRLALDTLKSISALSAHSAVKGLRKMCVAKKVKVEQATFFL